ncbi:MAG: hypothetical protein QOH15_734 [Gaiellales bacterium]|nr:hypothetical protein [Gaiellales bacterium]
MLGRKDYTPEELAQARSAVEQQLAVYRQLVEAVDSSPPSPELTAALEALEPLFFNNMAIVLDRYFVHRIRTVTGKDGNPLNEVELISDSLMYNDGIFRGNNVIKLIPQQSIAKLEIGDRIRLRAAQFEQLSRAFLDEIDARFVEGAPRSGG